MHREVIFLPDAALELEDAFTWYENQRYGLGLEYILCVETEIEIIRRNPLLFPVEYKDLRKALVKRFPYEIFYKEFNKKIVIFAVFHAKRNPKIYKKRHNDY